jgi:hypothetical protein
MHSHDPLTVGTAGYRTHEDAVRDLATVWDARTAHQLEHLAIALVGRDAEGTLVVERFRSTARHLAWGGALLGGALFLLLPSLGTAVLTEVGLSGAGVIIDHLHRDLPQEELARAAGILADGDAGLVVVALNGTGERIGPLLSHADAALFLGTTSGSLGEELCTDSARRFPEGVGLAS